MLPLLCCEQMGSIVLFAVVITIYKYILAESNWVQIKKACASEVEPWASKGRPGS